MIPFSQEASLSKSFEKKAVQFSSESATRSVLREQQTSHFINPLRDVQDVSCETHTTENVTELCQSHLSLQTIKTQETDEKKVVCNVSSHASCLEALEPLKTLPCSPKQSFTSSEKNNPKNNDDPLAFHTLECDSSFSHGSRKVSPQDFILLRVIGKGSYGKVMMVRDTFTNKIYAMKVLRKENIIKRNQVKHTITERNILTTINHPFIVQLYFAFQTAKKLYFVMEYCPGGELFFHLSRAVRFSEQTAIFYAAEIVLALEHLHNLDIVYRDLKPENVLLDEEGHIRLTDFGLSKEGIQDNFSAKSLCGTPEYLAPEILNRTGHGKAVDWWNLGALIYEMLTGLPPFYTRDRELLFENIRSGEIHYPSYMSKEATSLLTGLFQRDPSKRLGGGKEDALDIKKHIFFATIDWNNLFLKRTRPPFRPSLDSQTDVQYFHHEFVNLPVEHSEITESILPSTVCDELFQGFSYDRSDDG